MQPYIARIIKGHIVLAILLLITACAANEAAPPAIEQSPEAPAPAMSAPLPQPNVPPQEETFEPLTWEMHVQILREKRGLSCWNARILNTFGFTLEEILELDIEVLTEILGDSFGKEESEFEAESESSH